MEYSMNNPNMTSEDIILLHLYRNRSHLEDRRLPFAVCCEGIGETEGISIAKVAVNMRNLIHSGLVFFEKRYVETKRSPCRAYSLTPRGILRARIIGDDGSGCLKPLTARAGRGKDAVLLRRRDLALIEKAAFLNDMAR
jgi:hypothetical protein